MDEQKKKMTAQELRKKIGISTSNLGKRLVELSLEEGSSSCMCGAKKEIQHHCRLEDLRDGRISIPSESLSSNFLKTTKRLPVENGKVALDRNKSDHVAWGEDYEDEPVMDSIKGKEAYYKIIDKDNPHYGRVGKLHGITHFVDIDIQTYYLKLSGDSIASTDSESVVQVEKAEDNIVYHNFKSGYIF